MIKTSTRRRGGNRLKAYIKRAGKPQSVDSVSVGFFTDAKYQRRGESKGKPPHVASVAAWNEFGVPGRIPERPFFRRAIGQFKEKSGKLIKKLINKRTRQLDYSGANKLGLFAQGIVQREIVTLRLPPNHPATIKRKGSSNPLIDTDTMKSSVTYKINDD